MIIRRLDIAGFGKWQQTSLTIDSNFSMVFGDNEAGKSTIVHFIKEMFFGFPAKRGSGPDYTPKDNSNYGGSLIFEHPIEGRVKLTRIKSINKGKASLLFENGGEGDEDDLKKLLEPLTQVLFDEVFMLQQEQLIGIHSLEEDKLQTLLLSIGVTGSGSLVKAQQGFQDKASALYKAQGRLPELNKEVKVYEESLSKIRSKEEKEQAYQELLIHQNNLQIKLNTERENREQLFREIDSVAKQIKNFDLWQEQRRLKSLEETSANIKLTTSQQEELIRLESEFAFLKEQAQELEDGKRAYLAKGHESPAFFFYLQEEERIEGLLAERTKIHSLENRLDWLQELANEQLVRNQQLLSQLNLENNHIPKLPSESELKELAELGEEEASVTQELSQLENKFDYIIEEKEQWENNRLTRNRESVKKPNWALLISGLIVFLGGLLSLFISNKWLGIALIIVGSILLIFGSLKAKIKSATQFPENEEARYNTPLDELAGKIEATQSKLNAISQKKKYFVSTYYFNKGETVNSWLQEIPDRKQLIAGREKERQILSENSEISKGLKSFAERLYFLVEWLPSEDAEVSKRLEQLAVFTQEMSGRKEYHSDDKDGVNRWQEPLKVIKKKIESLSNNLVELVPNGSVDQLPLIVSQMKNQQKSQKRLRELEEQLSDIFIQGIAYELAQLTKEESRYHQSLLEKELDIKAQEESLLRLGFDLRKQAEDGTLSHWYQEASNQKSIVGNLGGKWLDYRLAEALIQEILDFLTTQQLPAILATASSFFKHLTLGSFEKVVILEKRIGVSRSDGEEYSLSELSTGTRDQLYLAIRLAFIQLHSQEGLAPVIIDDGWLHFDSQRKTALFEVLGRLSQEVQVICLSSDQEMALYMKEQSYSIVNI